ncbi:MAG: right-handed parallel beta-helix repeat-containing protein [Clostridia bacterium]|nr:right-handed parallel beta-helix repeat-containing protein [Clostridia bacterium]
MKNRFLSLLLILAMLAALLSACTAEEPVGSSSLPPSPTEEAWVPQRLMPTDGKALYTRLYSMFVSDAEASLLAEEAANLQAELKGVLPHDPPIGGGAFNGEIYTDGDYVVTTDDQLKNALKRAKAGQVIFIPSGVTIDISDLAATENFRVSLKEGVILASDRGVGEGGVLRFSHPSGSMLFCYENSVVTGLNLSGVTTAYEGHVAAQKDTGIFIYGENVTVSNCEIASFSGNGIRVASGGSGRVEHSYLHHCRIGIEDEQGTLAVESCAFFANESHRTAGKESVSPGESNGILSAAEPSPAQIRQVAPDIAVAVFPADPYEVYTLLGEVAKGDLSKLTEALALHSGTTEYYTYKDRFTIEQDGKIYGITPDGSPLGGGAGYQGILTSGDYTASTPEELKSALEQAKAGEVIFLPGNVQIDLTHKPITVPAGVTLASDRGALREDGSVSTGALLFTTVRQKEAVFLSENARLCGITLAGPDTERHMTHLQRGLNAAGNKYTDYYYSLPLTRGISVVGKGAEVDNCEIAGFSEAGVHLGGYTDITVHHNWIHHNQRNGFGYGVVLYGKTYVEVYRNLFNFDRHAIAADGSADSGYTAHDNAHLGTAIYHIFDAHGGADRGDGTKIACERVDMYNNVFLSDKIPYKKRGTPEEYSRFTRNIVLYPEMRYPYRQLYGENFICEDNFWGLSEELPVYDFTDGKTYALKIGGDLRLYEGMDSIDAKTHKLRYAFFLVFTPTDAGYYISEYGNNLDDGSINGEVEVVKIPEGGFVLAFTGESYKAKDLYNAITKRHEVIYNTSLGLDGDYIATRDGNTVTVTQSVE